MDNLNIITKSEESEIIELLRLLDMMYADKSTAYVSAPITTGTVFMDWYSSKGSKIRDKELYDSEHNNKVTLTNISNAKKIKNKICLSEKNKIISPLTFNRNSWSQDQYRSFWGKVIEKYVNKIYFLDGWEYSSGCVFEMLIAMINKIKVFSEKKKIITVENAINMISSSIKKMKQLKMDCDYIKTVYSIMNDLIINDNITYKSFNFIHDKKKNYHHYKDLILDLISITSNIAQFVSFSSGEVIKQRFSSIKDVNPNEMFSNQEAINELLINSSSNMVNIRSFKPESPKGAPLIYGLTDADDVYLKVKNNAKKGKISIVNETIDINDGGVSGVLVGEIMEFAPGSTPKCVDNKDMFICSLPRNIGTDLLKKIYGFTPELTYEKNIRVEFSIHPQKKGVLHSHTIIWELEKVDRDDLPGYRSPDRITWPNTFSEYIGDKLFGLLLLDIIGIKVPRTTAICRRIAPFEFGEKTDTAEFWIRTCPAKKTPGKFPTYFGWTDPFKMMQKVIDDPLIKGKPVISSVLSQESVNAEYSGSLMPVKNNEENIIIEGVKGFGDKFMVGGQKLQVIPQVVQSIIKKIYKQVYKNFGPVKLEWVYDGKKVWIVQVNQTEGTSKNNIIYEGDAIRYIDIQIHKYIEENGYDSFLDHLHEIKDKGIGINIIGNIGKTGHIGEALIQNKIPSRIVNTNT